jgi:23S rRNA (cytidine2498-2'-O)-methyltransferase
VPTAYLAAAGFEAELVHELGDAVRERRDRLVLTEGSPRPAAWAQNVWYDPETLPVRSIADAARQLRARGRNWALYSTTAHRRAALIEGELPRFEPRPIPFPSPLPAAPLGSFTLLDRDTLLAAPRCSSPFAHGEVRFIEDRAGPPSRAYLKLWEAWTLLGQHPVPGERVLDLGASPGGWTWAAASLGASVVAVDKAPLDPRVARLPGVQVLQRSAFSIAPDELGAFDWLVCDVACYPSRLHDLVTRWLAAGTARRFICTLKFVGPTDHATAARFAALPSSRLLHLSHNRHELTFMLALVARGPSAPAPGAT